MSETGYYNQKYYDYQASIGAFGGVANLFKFEQFISATDNVLDFGSGGGFLLANINCNSKIGVEINPIARENARIHGIQSVSETAEVPDEWASVIISNHALEHVHRPLDELKLLRLKLKAGGKIIFVVPHEGPQQDYLPGNVNRHLYTWNPMTLGNLFNEAGFQVIQSEALQHQWPPDYISLYAQLGSDGFHSACREYASKNGTYQIRVVGTK